MIHIVFCQIKNLLFILKIAHPKYGGTREINLYTAKDNMNQEVPDPSHQWAGTS